ncbi:MAG: imidazole glycerol phosphate synthase subunit HisH [Clostridiales bacterium]|jgi:glutamine amidotransferase|nr:imidazole glycerol phosphate synthase subunit HisH [Clostridiales bacterium]
MVAIADYGAGNITSVENILRAVGAEYVLAGSPRDFARAAGIILPGVGAFGAAAASLRASGLFGALRAAAADGVPFLGICLGLQLLFESSEESPGAEGLGLIGGRVIRLAAAGKKIPHIGWTSIDIAKRGRILSSVKDGEFFYFVHSYGAQSTERGAVAATADYGGVFDACVERGNIFGCQFHPEKSGAAGRKIIVNFLDMCGGRGAALPNAEKGGAAGSANAGTTGVARSANAGISGAADSANAAAEGRVKNER